MAYTVGGATTDDITGTSAQGMGATGTASFVAGWWYPTTLTATRGYWANSANIGMRVATTTSELNFRTNNATTPGQWESTGAGITTNQWWYIAILTTQLNAGPAGAARMWVGTELRFPDEVTVTQTVAPVGNYTGNSARIAGAMDPAGTLAFQGDIGWVSFIATNTVGLTNPLAVGTAGAIANAEADLVKQRLVVPLYLGRPNNIFAGHGLPTAAFSVVHFPLTSNLQYQWSTTESAPSISELTINGATLAQTRPPRAPPENWPLIAPLV